MKRGVTPSNVILGEPTSRNQVEYFVQARTHDCESEAWKQCYSRFKQSGIQTECDSCKNVYRTPV